MRVRWLALVALSAVAALAAIEPSGAYEWTGRKWPQAGAPCAFSCVPTPVTITYSFQNMFDGGLLMPNGQPLPASLIKGSIEEALGLWASYAPLHFVEVEDDGLFYIQGSTQFGLFRFRHIYIDGSEPAPPALPKIKAQAYFPSNVLGNLTGDVEFDHSDVWQEVGTIPQPDILGAAIHELGHSLGLGHSELPEANMYRIFTRFSGLGSGTLDQDDIDGIQYIYGAGSGSVTPLRTTPEPTSFAIIVCAAGWWFLRRPKTR